MATKFGLEINLRDLWTRFSKNCLWWAEAWSKKGKSTRGVYLLERPHPPDAPPGMMKLQLVKT